MNSWEIERTAFAGDPLSWMELYGAIVSKKVASAGSDERTKHPKANFLQRRIGDIVAWCLANRKPIRIVIVKPRQKGSSTVTVELCYVMSRVVGMNGLIVGGKEFQSNNLWSILKHYANHDAMDWGNEFTTQEETCGCTNGSKIQKLTAGSKDPGKSGTYHWVLFTELAHWPHDGTRAADLALTSILACVPKNEPGTIAIMESTGNGPMGVFPKTYNEAVEFEDFQKGATGNGYIRVFAAWHQFEDSWQELNVHERAGLRAMLEESADEKAIHLWDTLNLKSEQVAYYHTLLTDPECSGDESKRDQHYPTTPVDAFNASVPSRFNKRGLTYLEGQAEYSYKNRLIEWGILTMDKGADGPRIVPCSPGKPLANGGWTVTDPECNIVTVRDWRPIPGQRIIIGVDNAEGRRNCVGSDLDSNSAIACREGYWRPEIAGQVWEPFQPIAMLAPGSKIAEAENDEFAEWLWLFHLLFNRAILAPEKNKGRAIIAKLRDRGANIIQTPRSKDEIRQDPEEKLGWDTNQHTKASMISDLAADIRDYGMVGTGIACRFPSIVAQLRTFVRLDLKGTEGAMRVTGAHDDEVIALAIARACRESAVPYAVPIIQRPVPEDIRRALEATTNAQMKRGQYGL